MNLQGRVGGLRRPVAVRMSQLAEKQSEEVNEQTNSEEVNQNYKQYVKATPVAKTVEEVESDEQGRDSFSSCSSTPRGKNFTDLFRATLVIGHQVRNQYVSNHTLFLWSGLCLFKELNFMVYFQLNSFINRCVVSIITNLILLVCTVPGGPSKFCRVLT